MKEIKAYIRKSQLDPVIHALAKVQGLSGVSANTITGFGRSRGILRLVDFETHIKVEAVCRDELKDEVVRTILDAAQTGYRGDGKIFVADIGEAWRIETREAIANTP
ncbi:P-II family nitrogen regulator [Coraliomargarita parva]|uniref:P-II family nitrogen regulator n=1 Tax=Coraliomargarita parva TaxID=3014050 RepID=UPI0022B3970C|nr:P-II family nitrogen regulator [Coraliomargarita parva]